MKTTLPFHIYSEQAQWIMLRGLREPYCLFVRRLQFSLFWTLFKAEDVSTTSGVRSCYNLRFWLSSDWAGLRCLLHHLVWSMCLEKLQIPSVVAQVNQNCLAHHIGQAEQLASAPISPVELTPYCVVGETWISGFGCDGERRKVWLTQNPPVGNPNNVHSTTAWAIWSEP